MEVVKELYGKSKVIKGFTQSGKTNCMLSYAARLFVERISTIIILRNNDADLVQTRTRMQGMIAMMNAFIISYGFRPEDFPVEILEKSIDEAQYVELSTGSKPKILLTICHQGNLGNITKYIPKSDIKNDLKYAVMIDEVDLLDSSESQAKAEIDILKQHAYTIFGVSATVLDTLITERVCSGDIIQIPKPAHYRDHASLRHVVIPEARFSSKTTDNLLETDPTMSQFLDLFMNYKPIRCDMYNDSMPRMALINIGDTIKPMVNLFQHIKDNYGDKIVSIVLSGGATGIKLHARDQTQSITLGDGVKSSYNNGVHTFKKTGIQQVLAYLQEHGGYRAYPRIIIIGGDLAGRCVSFVSGDCTLENKLNWHLTDIRLVVAKRTDCPECHQKAGRGTGPFRQGVPIRLWCSADTFDTIRKYYWAQEELIQRSLLLMANTGATFSVTLPVVPLTDKKKIKTGHKMTKNAPFHPRIVKGPDGGYNVYPNYETFNFTVRPRAAVSAVSAIIAPSPPAIRVETVLDSEISEVTLIKISEEQHTRRVLLPLITSYLERSNLIGVWVDRSTVIRRMFPDKDAEYINRQRSVTFHMKQSGSPAEPTSRGFLMGKRNGSSIYMRLNL